MSNSSERYQKLAIGEALLRVHLYKSACKELSFVLRFAYNEMPKNLQSVVFQDTLTAFRLLPQMRTETAASAANLLLRGAEVALPKQKKNLAVTQFKQAKVAHKRLCKARQEAKDSAHLPHDVLVQIFGSLDVKSLASVGLVCWSWNLAATDNHLWHLQYDAFFGNPENTDCKLPREELVNSNEIDWKEAFRRSVTDTASKRLSCDRGHCRQCNTIVWLNETKRSNSRCAPKYENHQFKPILARQVVEYVLEGSVSMVSSSDSDSDSDDGLWAYPKNM